MYPDELTMRDARARHFAANGFSEAAYHSRWVTYKIGPVPIAYPNVRSRQRAIPFHDLHHVVTGYATTVTGEVEISAWEIAAGCGEHAAAWLIDATGFAFGLVACPRRTYRAFVRGRHTRTLYRSAWRDGLLDLTVGALRRELGLDRAPPSATWRDRAAFAGWAALVASPALLALLVAVHFIR